MRESSKNGPGEQRLSKYKIGHWWQRSGEKKKKKYIYIYIYIDGPLVKGAECEDHSILLNLIRGYHQGWSQ